MSFIEDDYEIPREPSKYYKFQDGQANRFRILGSFADGSAIRGSVYWTTRIGDDGKEHDYPVRVKEGVLVAASELRVNDKGELDMPKHFWALPVWNYEYRRNENKEWSGGIQILELTQKTLIDEILRYARNPKWGDPKEYDLVVTMDKKKRPMYSISANPKEKMTDEMIKTYTATHINLSALYDGGDPFSTETDIDDVKWSDTDTQEVITANN